MRMDGHELEIITHQPAYINANQPANISANQPVDTKANAHLLGQRTPANL